MYLAKVKKRIKDYQVKELNPPRPDKKLLVLDIDYTLFDHRSVAESGKSSLIYIFILGIAHIIAILCYVTYFQMFARSFKVT